MSRDGTARRLGHGNPIHNFTRATLEGWLGEDRKRTERRQWSIHYGSEPNEHQTKERRVMEIASFGETMIRLAPPVGFSLEGAQTLEVSIGGTESNLCIAYARLGGKCGWTSRMPDNAASRLVVNAIAVHGVDVSNVIWAPGEKLGILFVESGVSPRQTEVIYDRADMAIARLRPDELDYDYLLSAETLFLTPDVRYSFLSASLVREVSKLGGDVSRFVSPLVLERLRDKVGR